MNMQVLESVLRRMLSEQGKTPDPETTAFEALLELAKEIGPGPRGTLYLKVRERDGCQDKIYIWEKGRPIESTGVVPSPEENENPYLSLIARVKLALFVEERANGPDMKQELLKTEVAEALDRAVEHCKRTLRIRPTQNETEEEIQERRCNRIKTIKAHIKKLKTFFSPPGKKAIRMKDIDSETVGKYIAFRAELRIENQKEDGETPRFVTENTAIIELRSLKQLVRAWCGKHHLPVIHIAVPKLIKKTQQTWATWDQYARLVLAAERGCKFDEDGRFRRRIEIRNGIEVSVLDKEQKGSPLLAEFAPAAKLLLEGFYSGSRLNNSLDRRLGVGEKGGAYDRPTGILFGAGKNAVQSSKRTDPRDTVPPLDRAIAQWEEETLAKGATYLIHDSNGAKFSDQRMRALIVRIAENAGLPWFRPQDLKPTGATLMTYAGLPKGELAFLFSTRETTLDNAYIHLLPAWRKPLAFKQKQLEFRALKEFSPVSRERLMLVPKRWPRRGRRWRKFRRRKRRGRAG